MLYAPMLAGGQCQQMPTSKSLSTIQRHTARNSSSQGVVQRVLSVLGKTYGKGMGIAATEPMKKVLAENGMGTFSGKMLSYILFGLANMEEVFDEARIIKICRHLMSLIHQSMEQENRDREECRKLLETEQNQTLVKKIMANAEPSMAIIHRGVTPRQALQIMNNRTFGGSMPSMVLRDPPTEKDAQIQTGFGEKRTSQGILEEWSIQEGGLPGFATEGFMMIALVDRRYARFPSEMIGEAGVTGWTDQPLVAVAIAYEGKAMIGGDSLTREIDNLCKRMMRDPSILNSAVAATEPIRPILMTGSMDDLFRGRGGDLRSSRYDNPYGPAYYRQ